MKPWRCFLEDDRGNLSHARLIAVLVGFSATVFMWKLTIMGQLTVEYFMWYLGYGVVHQNLNKCLDVLNNFLGRRGEAKSEAPEPTPQE